VFGARLAYIHLMAWVIGVVVIGLGVPLAMLAGRSKLLHRLDSILVDPNSTSRWATAGFLPKRFRRPAPQIADADRPASWPNQDS
jgi:hypothetical protein